MIQVEDCNDSVVLHSAAIYKTAYGFSEQSVSPAFYVDNYNIVKYNEISTNSLFKNHQLEPQNTGLQKKQNGEIENGFGIFILLGLLLYTWLIYRNAGHFLRLSSSLFNVHSFSKKNKEKAWMDGLMLAPLTLLVICFYGLLFFQLRHIPVWDAHIFQKPLIQNEVSLLKLCLLFSTCFVLLKYFFIKVCAFIFRTEEVSYQYIQLILNYSIFTSVIGFPLLLLSFSETKLQTFLVITCLSISLLLLFIRFVRVFSIKIENTKFSYIHIFLYLCTLEFLIFLSSWKAFWMLFYT